MIAIIDIGSNALRLSVYEVNPGVRQIYKLRSAVGLAGYADEDGNISAEGVAEVCGALNGFRSTLDGLKTAETHAFATAALRGAPNVSEVISTIGRETGFDVAIISGLEEAMCGYVGATNHAPMNDGLLVDIGGGSTEIVICKDGKVNHIISIAVGALRMYSKYVTQVFPTKIQAEKIRDDVISELCRSGNLSPVTPSMVMPTASHVIIPAMCGMGGTMRALRKLNCAIFGAPPDSYAMSVDNAKKILNMIGTRQMLDTILHIIPERVHTITPGLIILDAIIDRYGCTDITVSDSGVREGYLIRNILQRDVDAMQG